MTTNFTPHAQQVAAQLRKEREAWVPIPPAKFADPKKNQRRGIPRRRKIRTIL